RRQSLEVVGSIEPRSTVDLRRARSLQHLDRLSTNVLGTLEHHVFEQVSESGSTGPLISRANVVPEVEGHHRQSMIFTQDDLKSVAKLIFLEIDLDCVCSRHNRHRLFSHTHNGTLYSFLSYREASF